VLVAPEAPEDMSRALAALIADPARRAALGEAGRRRVAERFALAPNIARLERKFGLSAAD
jgi:glycosyltransferase involved in cell wall biosynthesis